MLDKLNRKGRLLGTAILALALVATGCTGQTGSGGAFGNLTGAVTVDGSSTVFPVTQAVAEEFNKEAPGVKVSVGVSGTGGGFKKFCAGETDISDASRPIKDSEIQACQGAGIEYLELQVAIDGLSVLVNPRNDWARCLTTAELKTIWEPDSQVRNWSQVRDGFPSRPITLYGPGTDSGTFDYFTEEINGKAGASRSDYTASEDDNVLVQGISTDENALGYFGYAYFVENKDNLKALSVDGGGGCVEPTDQTINSGAYKPLSRPIFVYVSQKALARPEVVTFVDFYFDVVNDLVRDVGYIPMPAQVLDKQVDAWESFKDGKQV